MQDYIKTQKAFDEATKAMTEAEVRAAEALRQAYIEKEQAAQRLAQQVRTIYSENAPLVPRVDQNKGMSVKSICLVLAFFSIVGLCIVIGYMVWKPQMLGCKPYSCDFVTDSYQSYCDSDGCRYLWDFVVGGVVNTFNQYMNPNGTIYITYTPDQPPYPNGTTCYRPPGCEAFDAPWITFCVPELNCTKHVGYPGRQAFVVSMSVVGGLLFLFILLGMCIAGAPVDENESAAASRASIQSA